MVTEVSPRGWHEDTMQIDPGGHPAQAGSKRPATAGYASLVGNRVSQKGNPGGLAGLYPDWSTDLSSFRSIVKAPVLP